MFTIFRKEVRSYFGNYSAYIVSSIFILIHTLFLWFFDNEYNIFNSGEASLKTFFFVSPWVLLLLIPSLTMRQFAEEKQMGTLDWLFTQPIKVRDIIIGKYMSVLLILLFMLMPTIIYIYTLQYFSLDKNIDLGMIASGYLGLFLLGSMFAAFGICISAFTNNQIIAYVATVFCCFIFYYGFQGLSSYNLLGKVDYYIQQVGSQYHYDSFIKGIVDSRDLVYFIVVSAISLIITQFSIHKMWTK